LKIFPFCKEATRLYLFLLRFFAPGKSIASSCSYVAIYKNAKFWWLLKLCFMPLIFKVLSSTLYEPSIAVELRKVHHQLILMKWTFYQIPRVTITFYCFPDTWTSFFVFCIPALDTFVLLFLFLTLYIKLLKSTESLESLALVFQFVSLFFSVPLS
jgi:hypothetical protein